MMNLGESRDLFVKLTNVLCRCNCASFKDFTCIYTPISVGYKDFRPENRFQAKI